MSFDQALICHNKGGIFAAPWIAATYGSQALTKYHQTINIYDVDVGKTCDALRSTLKSDFFKIRHDAELTDPGKRDMVNEGYLPFRICTNIWFGTLKIYQQQVNILYQQSEDLVYGSNLLNSTSKPSCQRNRNLLKKGRLTIPDSGKIDLSERYYSELLEDFENFTQTLPEETTKHEEYSATVMHEQMINKQPKTHFQIREITIREISATTYGIAELDDDDGFGDASPEELTRFFTFPSAEENVKLGKGVAKKRKSDIEDEPPAKQQCFSHEANDEATDEHCESIPICTDFIPTPTRRKRTCEFSCDKTSSSKNNLNDIKEEPCENNFESLTHLGAPTVGDEIKLSTDFPPRKKTKLILDQCIKIEQKAMVQQISAPLKISKESPIEYLRNLKFKKPSSASVLLTTLNKRTERFFPNAKPKFIPNISQSQFEYDFLKLLHDIFKIEYKDSWATEIYPEYKTSCKQKKQKKNNTPTIPDFQRENIDLVGCDENNNPNTIVAKSITTILKQADNKYIEPINEGTSEWRPYGVMKKLLDSWRYCTDTKIDAVEFCHSAQILTNKALAFSSLLSLSKDQFIVISKRPKTIFMDKILLGQATKNLLQMEN